MPPENIGNFHLVDWGGHRYIYSHNTKPLIIKVTVPTDSNNNHNLWEYETYRDAPPEIKKHLAPIVGHADDFSWVAMHKAETEKTGLSNIAAGVAMIELKNELKKTGRNVAVWDLDPRQVGLINDKPVLIDYGFGLSWSDTYRLATGKDQDANIIGYRPKSEKLMWMTPQQFRSLTTDPISYDEPSLTKLKQRMKRGDPIDACWLDVDSKTWRVQRHEGRHRAKAAQELGIEKIPVILFSKDGYEWDSSDKLPDDPTLLRKQGSY